MQDDCEENRGCTTSFYLENAALLECPQNEPQDICHPFSFPAVSITESKTATKA